MEILFGNARATFRPWHPECGRVFDDFFAFDCETTLIDKERPWIIPAYVLGAAYDGNKGYFITRDRAAAFFAAHRDVAVVLHSAAFDLAVIAAAAPALDIYRLVDQHLAWDTQLLHRLLALGEEGHTAGGKGQSTLEHCTQEYLAISLPKDTADSQGNPVRLSYGQWLQRPPQEIEPVYLDYVGKDVMATFLVFQSIWQRLGCLLEGSSGTWGYVSPEWLAEQIRRWGPLTHHIQLKAAIVLAEITANGLTIDLARRGELLQRLEETAAEQIVVLRQYGLLPGQPGSGKALQEILRRIDAQYPDLNLQKTPTGKCATSEEALMEIASHEFVAALVKYRAIEKLRASFLDKMGRRVLHPSFDVLKVSGRTSSFGEINAQNLPRDERVRSCFIPSEGYVYIDADYSTVELATLAQAAIAQFGLDSAMATAINDGKDLHRLVAARVAHKREDEVTADERQKAKPINFGKPGAMGDRMVKTYAKATYGVELSDSEAEALSQSWFDLFPEMRAFLADNTELGLEVARAFGLTPTAYFEHTGSDKFLRHPENYGREQQPHAILGGMCIKVLRYPEPTTGNGRPYAPEEIDFFWTAVTNRIDLVPLKHQSPVRQRIASVGLQLAVLREFGRSGVFTLTGRLRANATYAARHNTIFQGLAADGAKLALWKLWRAGYRIVNFIHDEVLIEVAADSDLNHHADTIRELMIAGMKEVVPDVRIDVEYAATDHWSKGAEAHLDLAGRLQVWRPAEPGDASGASAALRSAPCGSRREVRI
ncbi:MAG: hypothetical protein GXY83_19955 [Rhodopirellula sp.]|nr:hypothetical protein [Rhodopirellula sp.]